MSPVDTSHVFEGVEKRIEISFVLGDDAPAEGLRTLSRSTLDELCLLCKCEIIHHEPLEGFDSYILSESSLFVFPGRIMIKTCGRTVPLDGVDFAVKQAQGLGLSLADVTYSRSSFLFPDLQFYPHNDLLHELEHLSTMRIADRVVPGKSSILGDASGKYWFVHRKEFPPTLSSARSPMVDTPEHRKAEISDRVTVDVIMTGLCQEAAKLYFKNPSLSDSENAVIMAKTLRSVLPEFQEITGKCYDPCGFSCNGHNDAGDASGERYFTVHITPEDAFSYASFEAVFLPKPDLERFGCGSAEKTMLQVESFLRNVVSVFSPQHVIVTICSSSESVSAPRLPPKIVSSPSKKWYVRNAQPYTSENLLGEDIVASSIYYSGVSSGNTGTKPTGLS